MAASAAGGRASYASGSIMLIEIVGVEVDIDAAHAVDLLGAHRRDAVLVLQHAIHDQKRLPDDDETITREKIRPHDDVRDPGFVLEREEHEAFGGTGALARDDYAGHSNALGLPQCGGAIVAERVERADVGERDHFVAPQSRAGDEIVERLESFAFALLLEREPLRRAAPVVRAVVAEPAPVVHALEHRRVI